jgi:Bacterial PH domain
MGIYRTINYKVEDLIIKMLSKKQDPKLIKQKVDRYRGEKEEIRRQRKEEEDRKQEEQKQNQAKKRVEQENQRREQEAREKREVEALISVLMNTSNGYSQYEFNEINRNKMFFKSFVQDVLEANEKVQSFIYCEFDKSSKQEIKGYLIPTNKRVLFINKNFTFIRKFRYQTIINLNWFKDGMVEKGIKIQYGKKKLEFDEMFDTPQMKRVGNDILTISTKRAI